MDTSTLSNTSTLSIGRSLPLKHFIIVLVAVFCLGLTSSAKGFQDPFNSFGGIESDEKITLSAEYHVYEGTHRGEIRVKASLIPEWYIHSLTQARPATPTELRLTESDDYAISGAWSADSEPETKFSEGLNVVLQKHFGEVTWSAPVTLKAGVDVEDLEIGINISGQYCKQLCLLLDENLSAEFAGYMEPPATEYRSKFSHVEWSGFATPSTAQPGEKITVWFVGKPDSNWHLYPYSDDPTGGAGVPTLIHFSNTNGLTPDATQVDHEPIEKEMFGEKVRVHHGETKWYVEFQVPADHAAGHFEVTGWLGYQVCDDKSCDPPAAVKFSVPLQISNKTVDGSVAMTFLDGPGYRDVEKAIKKSLDSDSKVTHRVPTSKMKPLKKPDSDELPKNSTERSGQFHSKSIQWEPFSMEALEKLTYVSDANGGTTPFDIEKHEITDKVSATFSWVGLLRALALGFLGGLILNVMPCVLPVIGLKIMSFVQQGGDGSGGQAFKLNVVYSLGIISVFLILATFGVFAGMTWGKQFQSQTFNIVLAAVVFVFALSLIGVWEIPIPGFVGTGTASKMAEQEGYSGAFVKGILTTILATPCTGPFIVPVLSWAFKQHPVVIYATFAAMGLGMASPFLIIGANPKLLSFLPKPGNWMVLFKQIMGFVLLGTVIWIMRAIRFEQTLPVLTFLFGLWVACWWIGRLSLTAPMSQKIRNWGVAGLLAFGGGYLAFGPVASESHAKFARNFQPKPIEVKERPPGEYTVLIDFTADW